MKKFFRILPTIYYSELSSTNDYCREHIQEMEDSTVVYTGFQTGGKGSRGRSWLCDREKMLALSMVLTEKKPEHLPHLPLVCGIAAVDALEYIGIQGAGIKWPNDIVLNGKKLCGILCESVTQGSETSIICGIGVNLTQTRKEFDAAGLPYAGSILSQTGQTVSRELMMHAVSHFFSIYGDFHYDRGFNHELRDRYRERCITLGKEVKVLWDGRKAVGLAKDVNPDGTLLCQIDGEEVSIHHGEASIRGLWDYV